MYRYQELQQATYLATALKEQQAAIAMKEEKKKRIQLHEAAEEQKRLDLLKENLIKERFSNILILIDITGFSSCRA